MTVTMAVLNAATVEEKVRALSGNLAAVGRALGVTRQAVWDYCRRRPKLRAVIADCREAGVDDVEDVLRREAMSGQAWAVCFFLKAHGKSRGYVERHEVTGEDGGPVRLALEEMVAARKALRDREHERNGTGHDDPRSRV